MITDDTLSRQCEQSGWPCVARTSGRMTVALEVTPVVQAVVALSGTGVRVFADLLESDAAAGTSREAIMTLLRDTVAAVRRVQVVAGKHLGFEVNFPALPSPEELDDAFCCLSVACRLASTELPALLDEQAAQDFLLVRGVPADVRNEPQTQ
jgi:hypothetical protein